MTRIQVYTDGSARPNPGPGGWAVVVVNPNGDPIIYRGHDPDSTNNRMELTAVIEALARIPHPIDLYTDSQYVKRGITEWIIKWKANGWMTAARKPVKNHELWIALDELSSKRDVNFRWVKAHNKNKYNELADKIASEEAIMQ